MLQKNEKSKKYIHTQTDTEKYIFLLSKRQLYHSCLAALKKSKFDKFGSTLKSQWFTEIFIDGKICYLGLLQKNPVGEFLSWLSG